DALRLIAQALTDLNQQRGGLAELLIQISLAQFERALDRRDAAALADGFKRTLPVLTAEARRAVLTKLAERFADLHKSSPNDAFTASFAELLARLAEAGTIDESLRAELANRFIQMAQAAFDRKNYGSAATLLSGALKVDPSR